MGLRCCHSAVITNDEVLILGGYNFEEDKIEMCDFLNQSSSSDKFSSLHKQSHMNFLGFDKVLKISFANN